MGRALSTVPPGFTPHPKLVRLLKDRAAMAAGEKPIDWGMGEALALARWLGEGVRVRMSGQDVRRGTFSHRHAVLVDYADGAEYTPLEHVGRRPGDVRDPGQRRCREAGRAGLRIRLQPGHARGAGDLGGAVRRLRQRRPGDHRSVPGLVGGQVEPGERPGDAAAPRDGGAGARTLERAARALPQHVASTTTSRSATSPRRRSSSTCCAGR